MLQAMFLDLFCLCPQRQCLVWRKSHKRVQEGTIAGFIDKRSGRGIVVVNRKRYYTDDIIHCMKTGSLPGRKVA